MKFVVICILCMGSSFLAKQVKAEFIISTSIVEFNQSSPAQQDIQAISNGQDNDYIATEISEIINPGSDNEQRVLIDDPTKSMLIVTPEKSILTAGTRKLLRFVLLKSLDNKEHIYRVAIKPVIKGVESETLVGLKILVGYEVLVIIRPEKIHVDYAINRQGKTLTITNKGNSNILLQQGLQCTVEESCPQVMPKRVYAGQTDTIALPLDKPVTYMVWDGAKNEMKTFK